MKLTLLDLLKVVINNSFMERTLKNDGLLNDGDNLSFENMMETWEQADKFDKAGHAVWSLALISEFYNRLALISDGDLLKRIDAIIHPWKYK